MARDYDDESYEEVDRGGYSRARWPHSGIGIASFIAGIVALLMTFGAIALMVVAVAGARHAPEPPQKVVVLTGLIILGAGLIALIGVGLGIGGCCQTDRKKVFAIVGLVINALLLLGIIGLMLVGLASRQTPVQAKLHADTDWEPRAALTTSAG